MRNRTSRRSVVACLAVLCALLATAPGATAGTIAPDLQARLATSKPSDEIAVIMTFADRLDLTAYRGKGRRNASARAALLNALKAKAGASQKSAATLLASSGAKKTVSLWLINGISFTAPAWVMAQLAALQSVDTIRLDATLSAPQPLAATSATPEWNLAMVRADEMWSLGYTGGSVVVAGMDTGVDVDHPDLAGSWRGGSNSWYDPNGQHAIPSDASGHGTQTMGIIVGGSKGGTAIGMAPGAKWIAVKIFNDAGTASLSAIHQGFQWLLDPDANPATNDAPDVVNNSWGYPSYLNQCYREFENDIAVLKAADIAVVFSAGNSGPSAPSSVSPADNAGSFAVGAVDTARTVASFSSRGPSACDGSVFPEAVAPGVNVRTSDLTFGGIIPDSYAYVSGTSFAAPHLAGAMVLLLSAHPTASVPSLEQALESGAVDLGAAGSDNSYGYGLIDVVAASALLGSGGRPSAADDAYATAEDASLTVSAPGVLSNDTGSNLSASLVSNTGHGTVTLGADGSFAYVPDANFSGSDSFTYTASDGSQASNVATVRITVTPVNDAPVAANDAYAATAGTGLLVAAPGVLANDTDADGNALTSILVSGPSHASSFALNANASFSYTAVATYSGSDKFTYKANDGTADSNVATVTITVSQPTNQPPVAVVDSASTTRNTAVTINVLANDYDPDGTIVASSVAIVTNPTRGKVLKNTNGTVKYTPNLGFRGTDSFKYTVKDNKGATSNVATVTVTVQ